MAEIVLCKGDHSTLQQAKQAQCLKRRTWTMQSVLRRERMQ